MTDFHHFSQALMGERIRNHRVWDYRQESRRRGPR